MSELIYNWHIYVSLVVQTVNNLPVTLETQVQSLGWADPLEKRMATHSSILAILLSCTIQEQGVS